MLSIHAYKWNYNIQFVGNPPAQVKITSRAWMFTQVYYLYLFLLIEEKECRIPTVVVKKHVTDSEPNNGDKCKSSIKSQPMP